MNPLLHNTEPQPNKMPNYSQVTQSQHSQSVCSYSSHQQVNLEKTEYIKSLSSYSKPGNSSQPSYQSHKNSYSNKSKENKYDYNKKAPVRLPIDIPTDTTSVQFGSVNQPLNTPVPTDINVSKSGEKTVYKASGVQFGSLPTVTDTTTNYRNPTRQQQHSSQKEIPRAPRNASDGRLFTQSYAPRRDQNQGESYNNSNSNNTRYQNNNSNANSNNNNNNANDNNYSYRSNSYTKHSPQSHQPSNQSYPPSQHQQTQYSPQQIHHTPHSITTPMNHRVSPNLNSYNPTKKISNNISSHISPSSPQNIQMTQTWQPNNQYYYTPPYATTVPFVPAVNRQPIVTPPTRKALSIVDPTTGTVVSPTQPSKEEKPFEFVKQPTTSKAVVIVDPAIRDQKLQKEKEEAEAKRLAEEAERVRSAEEAISIEKKPQAAEEIDHAADTNNLTIQETDRLTHSRKIKDLTRLTYPDGILIPQINPQRIIYPTEFLLQFQPVCLESPVDLSGLFKESGESIAMSRQPSDPAARSPDTAFKIGSFNNEMGKFNMGRTLIHRTVERQPSYGRVTNRGRGGMKIIRLPPQPLEQVQPLEPTQNRWVPSQLTSTQDGLMTQEFITRKVNALLNKLTMEKFESISSQIFEYAKQSEKEDNGLTLRTVIKLIFEKACDEPAFATMWAKLCQTIYEAMTDKIKDTNILDDKQQQQPVSGPLLFRKYLFNRCQTEFEKGWKVNLPEGDDAETLLSEEYYIAAKAKRQGLGLIQFIGEVFKLGMLSERIMYHCILKLSNDPSNAGDEEAESLCKLLTTIGKVIDSKPSSAKWLDVILNRMKNEMAQSPKLTSRVRFMIEDVLDLRRDGWVPRKASSQVGPTTIAKIHELAEKEKASRPLTRPPRSFSQPKESPEGWNTVQKNRLSDLSNFGKVDRSRSKPNLLGPSSSPFASLGRSKTLTEKSSPSTDLRPNMFSALSDKPKDLKAPVLKQKLSDEAIKRKSKNILEEYLSIQDKTELCECIKELDEPEYLVRFIEEMLSVVEKKAQDVEKMCETIQYINSQNLLQKEAYLKAFKSFMEGYDDLTIDVPQAPKYVAQLLVAASVTPEEIGESFPSLDRAYKSLIE